MNYTDLTTNIEDICEKTFTADQLAMFTQQAEIKIHNTVHSPALRKINSGSSTTGSAREFTLPVDLNYMNSFTVVDGSGEYHIMIQVDSSFMLEAYPDPTEEGLPKYYAFYSEDRIVFGPTPDVTYSLNMEYGYYPESIVTASTTWLGDHFDAALLNGALVEAIRFMKGEPDMIELYEKMYLQSLTLFKQLGEGRLQQDTFLKGQPSVSVG
jgi:hypothetical protein